MDELAKYQQLATRKPADIDTAHAVLTIGDLERMLLEQFPAENAEPWDKTGLLVGDAACPITRVAVALDATIEAVDIACAQGANVLITHHPVFLDAPDKFAPSTAQCSAPGAVVYAAIRQGVALMNFHTAFDVSAQAQHVLPGMLGLEFAGVIEPTSEDGRLGYGQRCFVRSDDQPMTLAQLSARCLSVFGRPARVWGANDAVLAQVVCANGAAGDMPARCLEAGVDCLICGEVKYHAALDAAQAGLCIIELGHDVSELPYIGAFMRCLVDCGLDPDDIFAIDQSHNWAVPEAIRL